MEELKADPTVDVIVAKVGEPADDCSIEELEEGQGAQIHPEVLSFYRSCGGVQLLWYTVGDPAVDPDEARDLAGAFRAMDDVAIVERMNRELNRALETTEIRQRFDTYGAESLVGSSPEAAEAFGAAQRARRRSLCPRHGKGERQVGQGEVPRRGDRCDRAR
jgi:hypothetical protein